MVDRLKDKIALVTGAGNGIGRAIAARFAEAGAHVYVTDINGVAAEDTVAEIKSKGGGATAMVLDVSRGQDIQATLRTIDRDHGRIDVLVNNAGILVRGEIRSLSDEEWTRLREVNLDGVVRVSRDALPLLRKSNAPSIINISSIMAHRGIRPLAAYSATKGAITALTKGLAVEYGPFKIRVNCVAPGYVETALTDRMLKIPQFQQALIDKTIMGRLGLPEEITGAVLFFATDDSRYCTGTELIVDGGMMAML